MSAERLNSVLSPVRTDSEVQPYLEQAQQLHVQAAAQHTWDDLVHLLSECMVEDLRRAPEMLELYKNTGPLIKSKYGSTANFIKWKLDFERDSESISQNASWPAALAHDAPPSQYRITLNDFPYGIPQDGQHFVVWGRVPLLIREAASSAAEWEDVEHRGIAGFTGFPELQDRGFGVQDGQCGEQMRRFVERHWPADEGWQTMFFINPFRFQTVPELPHLHVFARQK